MNDEDDERLSAGSQVSAKGAQQAYRYLAALRLDSMLFNSFLGRWAQAVIFRAVGALR
ncbi:MAG TPA: hypothetical protein VN643_13485 [Pyrinomonadaceae bacterium]|nr:hypothetical protein [Pyrinomonadaceae bacterium]